MSNVENLKKRLFQKTAEGEVLLRDDKFVRTPAK